MQWPRRALLWILSSFLLALILSSLPACGSSSSEGRVSGPKQNSIASGPPVAVKGMPAAQSIIDRLSPAGVRQGNAKGSVSNDAGELCSFSQAATDDGSVSYFYNKLTGSDTLLVFDDATCMNPLAPQLMAFNQRMVNQVIARWYSKPDAKFMVHPHQLTRKGQLQAKGWCMQSETYPTQGILIDYFGDNQSLMMVAHNYALGGCENSSSGRLDPTSTRTISLNQRTEYVPSYNTWQPAQDITPVATVAPPQVPTPFPVIEPTPRVESTKTAMQTIAPHPTPMPTPMPSPTPDGPLMPVEECSQVIEAYMAENIEDIILSATDNPMSFRYWIENDKRTLGYRLHFKTYTGFGDKLTHHEVLGSVLVHWWDNTTRNLYVEFYPHAVTCLPVRNPEYTFREIGKYEAFEYKSTVGPILVQWDPYVGGPEGIEYRLHQVWFVDTENPTGIVEIER